MVIKMPLEARYLVFQLAETETLLRTGLVKLGRTAPPGRLACMAGRRSHFVFLYDSGRTARVSPAELFAAVLWHCQKQRIPIPQQLQKRFEIFDRRLVLVSGDLARARSAAEALGDLDRSPNCPLCAGGLGDCVLDHAEEEPAGAALACRRG